MQTVTGKIRDVPDSVCEGCPQNYQGECRAYLVPSSDEERLHRLRLNAEGSFLNCEYRPPMPGEKYIPHGGYEVKVMTGSPARRGEKKRYRVWFTTPRGFEHFIDVWAESKEEARRLGEKRVPEGSIFRYAFEVSPGRMHSHSSDAEEVRRILRPYLQDIEKSKIPLRVAYSYDRGEMYVDRQEFPVGRIGLTPFGEAVKEEVEKVFGELEYVGGTFREEVWSNDRVEYETYASFGYLSIDIRPR